MTAMSGVESRAMPVNNRINPSTLDQSWERATIGKNQPGQLIALGGDAKKGVAITIHGINDAPTGIAALTNARLDKGGKVSTFGWDDNYRRLDDTANDFARSVKSELSKHPGSTLRIDAHSMGGRVALVALGRLQKEGALNGKKVELNLIAPPLGGYGGANAAGWAPKFAQGIKNVRPGVDMGSTSDFQKELEAVRLPNVKVSVFGGSKDETAPVDGRFREIAKNLGAKMTVVDGADHMSILASVASRL